MRKYKRKKHLRSFRYNERTAVILAEYNNDLDLFVADVYDRLPELKEQITVARDELYDLERAKDARKKVNDELWIMGLQLRAINDDLSRVRSKFDELFYRR